MRIGYIYPFVYPNSLGGGEHRIYRLGKALESSETVTVYGRSSRRRSKEQGRRVLGIAAFSLLLPFRLLRGSDDIWEVTSYPYFPVLIARLIALVRHRPLVVTWLELIAEDWNRLLGPLAPAGRLLERWALACSPAVIAISETTKRRLVRAGCPEKKIVVLPCGIDRESILATPPDRVSTDLICVGRLTAHKRFHLAIEALALVRRTIPGATLALVGSGPEEARLRELTSKLGLDAAVSFLGALPDARSVYARLKSSRVLVAPSIREGFGLIIPEAWACGIPAVVCAAEANAMAELVDEEVKGRVTAPTAAAIAEACGELLGRARGESVERLAAAAAQYDWNGIAAEHRNLYRRLVASSR